MLTDVLHFSREFQLVLSMIKSPLILSLWTCLAVPLHLLLLLCHPLDLCMLPLSACLRLVHATFAMAGRICDISHLQLLVLMLVSSLFRWPRDQFTLRGLHRLLGPRFTMGMRHLVMWHLMMRPHLMILMRAW